MEISQPLNPANSNEGPACEVLQEGKLIATPVPQEDRPKPAKPTICLPNTPNKVMTCEQKAAVKLLADKLDATRRQREAADEKRVVREKDRDEFLASKINAKN